VDRLVVVVRDEQDVVLRACVVDRRDDVAEARRRLAIELEDRAVASRPLQGGRERGGVEASRLAARVAQVQLPDDLPVGVGDPASWLSATSTSNTRIPSARPCSSVSSAFSG
jgi:hypothetical protein